MATQPRILVVEDEPAIAELLLVNLRYNGYQASWATDATEAYVAVQKQKPDLVLLDWMLPGESGVQLAQRWRATPATAQLPIIMLTARGSENDRVQGLGVADDYITKPFSPKELLARVAALLRRCAPAEHNVVLEAGALRLDTGTHRVHYQEQGLKLGPTEFKLLQFFMSNAERVHSRAQLLQQVWGDAVSVEERTVDVHVKRLREALGEAASMVETVRGAGYRFTAQG